MELKQLAQKIKSQREAEKTLNKKVGKQVKILEDGLRKLPQYVGDCPLCTKPMICFGNHDYDWDSRDAAKGYDDTLIGGDNKHYHDSCFFAHFGHLD